MPAYCFGMLKAIKPVKIPHSQHAEGCGRGGGREGLISLQRKAQGEDVHEAGCLHRLSPEHPQNPILI